MRVLTVNAGSSSIKLRLLDSDDVPVHSVDIPSTDGGFDKTTAMSALEPFVAHIDAVGHRVVHGGDRFTGPVRLDPTVDEAIRELSDLAPLHQAKSLAGIDWLRSALPDVPAVACFDTAFHSSLPASSSTYAIPAEWRSLGVRRYGFHGLSHAYASRRAASLLGRRLEELRTVTCHLGAGASLAAVLGGISVDTTMGFTPLEGLVMATRSGTVDPGMVGWLVERLGLGVEEVTSALERASGLVALAGTADMAAVLRRAARGDARAGLAVDTYVHRLRAGIAAMAASLAGLDAVVFTGGVGENATDLRAIAASGLGFLGVALDEDLNSAATTDTEISPEGARVHTLVVSAREDVQMAQEVRAVLHGS